MVYAMNWHKRAKPSAMVFNPEPVIPIYTGWPENAEKALKHVHYATMNAMKGREAELLIAILPDNNGTRYGDLKRICETDVGLISLCCLTDKQTIFCKCFIKNQCEDGWKKYHSYGCNQFRSLLWGYHWLTTYQL